MKKYFLLVLAALFAGGCSFSDWFGGGGPSSTSSSPRQQINDARASFDQKISSSSGKPLSKVQKEWGKLEKGPSRDGLTIYTWSQTARFTAPAGEVTPAHGGQETASCLAVFIVNPGQDVVDANYEGQCYNYRLMPAWRPYVLESTDGRTGPVSR